jgi:hypothetical protein
MSTPTLLSFNSRFSAALSTRSAFRIRKFVSKQAALGLFVIALTACGESSVTGPTRSMNHDEVTRVMPAITDARVRLSKGIKDIATRQQLIVDMSNLEFALRSDDVVAARQVLASVNKNLETYRSTVINQDGADMSAMKVMLDLVTPLVSNGTAQ